MVVNEHMFGGPESPLRECPQFRNHMERYKMYDKKIDELQARKGYLSYDEFMELKTLKKLKLAAKDEMIKWKRKIEET